MFATADGRHLSPSALSKNWPRVMAAIGMSGVTLHSLRHTHASMLIALDHNLVDIQRRLGHRRRQFKLKARTAKLVAAGWPADLADAQARKEAGL